MIYHQSKMIFAVDIGSETLIRPGVGIRSIGTLGNLLSNLLPTVYLLSSVVLFLLLIFGGIAFILGAGSSDQQATKQAGNAIAAAIFGFLIIFVSYWIIQLIEVITGVDILRLPI